MGKNILILNGSPRPNGNTAALVAAFAEGAEAAGHAVSRFDLGAMDIHGCLGCFHGGGSADHPCVQRDDMDRIYPAYLAADVVVLASPMYYWGVSGQLKCAFDRLFAAEELGPDHPVPVRAGVLLMAAGSGDPQEFAPALACYRALLRNLGWRDAGAVCAGGNLAPGDIRRHPEQLEAARRLGGAL